MRGGLKSVELPRSPRATFRAHPNGRVALVRAQIAVRGTSRQASKCQYFLTSMSWHCPHRSLCLCDTEEVAMTTSRTVLPLSGRARGGLYPTVEHVLAELPGVMTIRTDRVREVVHVEYDCSLTSAEFLMAVLDASGLTAEASSRGRPVGAPRP